ncbi:MAG: hypothetical protein EXS52_02095 [Candidatus Staskawiczbacteria bacterium]|nr:hypothetical protein [Candidatus Staskawiczbacteria bacterium]
MPDHLRGLYVIVCGLGEVSHQNLGLGEELLGQGNGAGAGNILVLQKRVATGRGYLAARVNDAEQLFLFLLRWAVPALSERRNLAVGKDWFVVEIDDPTGM